MNEFFKKILLGKRYEKPVVSTETGQREIGFELHLKTGTITGLDKVDPADAKKAEKAYLIKIRQLKQKLSKEASEYISWEGIVFKKSDFKICITKNRPCKK